MVHANSTGEVSPIQGVEHQRLACELERTWKTEAVPDRPSLLDERYDLAPGTIERFESAGHAVVRELAPRPLVERYKPAIDEATMALRWDTRPLEERDTYGRAFIQSGNVHRHSRAVAEFALARRFARVAADLLQCEGVRLYHDQALYKEPGGGFTPWHQDQVYWPLDSDRTITMWMPLVDIPQEVGGMTFADGSWRHGNLGELVIGDASHEFFETLVAEHGFTLSTHGPFAAGDATFHRGWTLHSAPANESDLMRAVLTVIYYADGTRISEADHPARRFDLALWLGAREVGSVADGPGNPLLWHRSWES